jgi:hypothetical protein
MVRLDENTTSRLAARTHLQENARGRSVLGLMAPAAQTHTCWQAGGAPVHRPDTHWLEVYRLTEADRTI